MCRSDRDLVLDVCYGSGDLQYPAVGSGAETELIDGLLQEAMGFAVYRAELSDEPTIHLGVAVDVLAGKTLFLSLPCWVYPLPYLFRGIALTHVGEISVVQCGDLNMDVYPVKQRSGDTRTIFPHLEVGAAA